MAECFPEKSLSIAKIDFIVLNTQLLGAVILNQVGTLHWLLEDGCSYLQKPM